MTVDPVVVDAEHAIAGWTQGEAGGWALLRRKGRSWVVVLCSGDPLKVAETLESAGVDRAAAHRLTTSLAEAERAVSPERLMLFAKFQGTIRIDRADAGGHGHNSTKSYSE